MQEKLNKIRQQIKLLKAKEAVLMLDIIRSKAKEKGTIKLPGVEKTTWKKLDGQLSRSQIYRRAKKQTK